MKDYLYKLFCGTNAEFVTKKTVTMIGICTAVWVEYLIYSKQPEYLFSSLVVWLTFILVVLGIIAVEKLNVQGLLNKFTKTEEPTEPTAEVPTKSTI